MRCVLLSCVGLCLAAVTGTHSHGQGVEASSWVRTYVQAHGGCGPHRNLFQALIIERGSVEKLLGKPVKAWSRADADEAIAVYRDCDARFIADGRHDRVKNSLADAYAASTARQIAALESSLAVFVGRGQSQAAASAERESAVARQADSEVDARLQRAERAARLEQDRLREQARRDRDEAERVARLVDSEGQKIEALKQQADKAFRARRESEQKLADIQSRVAAAELARQSELRKAEDIELARQRAVAQEQYKQEGERLKRPCKIGAEQFGKAVFGMRLRDVEILMGCSGQEISSTRISGLGVISVYYWEGMKEPSAATLTFKNSTLESKSQLGLE